MSDFVVRPLPGSGLVFRVDGLFGVCAYRGNGAENLIDLVTDVAKEGGDGASLVTRAADILATSGGDRFSACAAAGFAADGAFTVLLYGAATAELAGNGSPVHLSGEELVASVHRISAGATSVRLALADAGAVDPRVSLDAGVVAGGGVIGYVGDGAEPTPPPLRAAAGRVRQPDLSVPFESMLLVPGVAKPVESPGAGRAPAESTPARTDPVVPVTGTSVLVEGVYCKNSHFNDPAGPYCQVCGASMADVTLESRLGPRPPLGILLLNDGTTVRLDSDYVLGLDPETDPQVADGRARPLRIDDPIGGLSRRHLHVALADWTVQAIDLGSANGTFVQAPGDSEPARLLAGRPVEIRPGTRITVGRWWLRYESHRNP